MVHAFPVPLWMNRRRFGGQVERNVSEVFGERDAGRRARAIAELSAGDARGRRAMTGRLGTEDANP